MEPTQSLPGKRVQASHDWLWFHLLLDNTEVTRAYFKPVAERRGNALSCLFPPTVIILMYFLCFLGSRDFRF